MGNKPKGGQQDQLREAIITIMDTPLVGFI